MNDTDTRNEWAALEDTMFDQYKSPDSQLLEKNGMVGYIQEFRARRLGAGLHMPEIADDLIGQMYDALNTMEPGHEGLSQALISGILKGMQSQRSAQLA